jgi:hypothetical protein
MIGKSIDFEWFGRFCKIGFSSFVFWYHQRLRRIGQAAKKTMKELIISYHQKNIIPVLNEDTHQGSLKTISSDTQTRVFQR